LLDIVDYWILRAVMHYYAELPAIDPDDGLNDDTVRAAVDDPKRYALVFAHYLAGSISLARAAELLGMPWLELRIRCQRLDVPLRTAPEDADQAAEDIYTTTQW
jgi:predicted HTH domain antitoxin